MKTLKEQNKILKKHFNITVKLPKKEVSGYAVPKWQRVASTYPKALQKVLDAIKSTRPFYNWREGQIDNKHIRRPDIEIPEILNAQMGEKHKGESVEYVRANKLENENLLGAYEVGVILLTHPKILKSYDDLWIDCPLDEWSPGAGGEFSSAPVFVFDDGGVEFGAFDVGATRGHCGSASWFSPQSNLESRNLESFESLTLESRLEKIEAWIRKEANFINPYE